MKTLIVVLLLSSSMAYAEDWETYNQNQQIIQNQREANYQAEQQNLMLERQDRDRELERQREDSERFSDRMADQLHRDLEREEDRRTRGY